MTRTAVFARRRRLPCRLPSPFRGVRTAYNAHLWEIRPARDCRAGDLLVTASGLARVTRRADTYGGVELTVCPVGAAASHLRILWFWPQEPTYHHHPACPCGQVNQALGVLLAPRAAQDQGGGACGAPGLRWTSQKRSAKRLRVARIRSCASGQGSAIGRPGDQLALPGALAALARERNPPVLGRGRRLPGVRP